MAMITVMILEIIMITMMIMNRLMVDFGPYFCGLSDSKMWT